MRRFDTAESLPHRGHSNTQADSISLFTFISTWQLPQRPALGIMASPYLLGTVLRPMTLRIWA